MKSAGDLAFSLSETQKIQAVGEEFFDGRHLCRGWFFLFLLKKKEQPFKFSFELYP